MNKNFMKSSVKALAVAVAALAFTSCSKDTFTEKDALNLELNRLRAQRTIDSIKTLQDRADRNALLRYQRALDSLDRENAGGRVFYTVNVVSATASAVSNGRTEESEGVTGATVTTSQYGRVVSATTQAGIATFELRSGEATVAITAPAHTSADYTVNLTGPFSGAQTQFASSGNTVVQAPKNGSTVYVGNVVPLFEVSTDGADMATIRGRAFIETDLTNDVEEIATASNAAITAAGAVANIFVSAGINTQGTFFARFLGKTGEFGTSGTQNGGTSTSAGLGRISKIFYGPVTPATGSGSAGAPVTRVAIGATGDYTLLVPASVSGLPINIKSDEIVANRTYFRAGGIITTQRFLYGPNVTADGVPVNASVPRVTFQAFTTAATVTASYQPQVAQTAFLTGNYGVTVGNGATRNRQNFTVVPNSSRTAFYASRPTVTLTPTIAQGTGVALGDNVGGDGVSINMEADTTTFGRRVRSIEINAGGSGYAVNNNDVDLSVAFTRTDVGNIGTATRVVSQGGSISGVINVTDGGFGFTYPNPATFDQTTQLGGFGTAVVTTGFTGALPRVNFGNILPPATAPVATAIPDVVAGTISAVFVNSPGSNLSSIPAVAFSYGTGGALPAVDALGNALFESNGTNGVQFNFDNTGAAGPYALPAPFVLADYTLSAGAIILNNTANAQAASTTVLGSGYTFVPTGIVNFTGTGTLPAGITPPVFTFSVTTGNPVAPFTVPGAIARIDITSGGIYPAGFSGAVGTALNFAALAAGFTGAGLSIQATSVPAGSSRGTNTLAANATGGSGLNADNYTLIPQTILAGASAAGYTNVSLASNNSADASNAPLTPNIISNLLAGSSWIGFVPGTGVTNQAWGIPVINGNDIIGFKVINAGAGYVVGTTYNLVLMPNPFRGTAIAAPYTAAAAAFAAGTPTVTNFFTGAYAVQTGRTLQDALNNSGNWGIELAANTAFIEFTVTNGGAGYATAPTVVIADGGLTFTQISTLLGAVSNTSVPVSMNNGAVARVGTNTTGALAANVGRVNIPAAPAFLSNPAVFVIDQFSKGLTDAFNDGFDVDASATIEANERGSVSIGANGAVTGISIPENLITSTGWPAIAFHQPPLVTLSAPATGTTATAVVDPAPTGIRVLTGAGNLGKVQAVRVTNGGSGYGRGNLYQRWFGSLTGGQDYAIIGGNSTAGSGVGTATQGGANAAGSTLDAMTGVTYVRDIHYGTGRLLD